jgi:beta-lactam-binding protein with PASTA domain
MRLPAASAPVRRRVWSIGRFLVLMAALAGTFAIFFLAGLRVTTHAREVEVPDLHGQSIAEAKTSLSTLGLVLQVDPQRRPDRTLPADHVLAQEPEAGAVVRRQRAVRVRVSDGQRDPLLPTVTNLPERSADMALTSEQIEVAYRAEIRSTAYRSGAIVAQDPGAGERGSTVSLLVNRGDATISYVVPDLIGTLAVRATEILRSQSFRVAVTAEVPYPGLPPGVVIRQAPQPGFRIQPSETITLEVSR